MDKKKLAAVIDTCIDLSSRIQKAEIVFKGFVNEIKTEIDEISTTLFFHYNEDENNEDEKSSARVSMLDKSDTADKKKK